MSDRKEIEAAVGEQEAHHETMAQLKQITDHSGISEKKLLLKTDLHVVPILFLLFLCAFIDRINIGNARMVSI